MALSDDLDDLRDQLESRPPMVKYGDKPGLTIPSSDMNNNLDTVVVGGDVAIEAARIAITAGDDALASMQSAEQAATKAADAATTAVDAKGVAVAAETVVVDAKNAAVQANTDAQEAKDMAVAARDEAVETKDILVPAIGETLEARDQAVAASTTAVGAADTATTKAGEAAASAAEAEYWAGQSGEVVSVQGKKGVVSLVREDFSWMGDAAESDFGIGVGQVLSIDVLPQATPDELRTGTQTAPRIYAPKTFYDAAAFVSLTSSTTITPNLNAGNNFNLALSHNATLANPTGAKSGQRGSIYITHDGTKTLSYGSAWKFLGLVPNLGTLPVFLDYCVINPTTIIVSASGLGGELEDFTYIGNGDVIFDNTAGVTVRCPFGTPSGVRIFKRNTGKEYIVASTIEEAKTHNGGEGACVTNITNMSQAFYQATSFNQDISTWDTSNVTNMERVFYQATSFNQDISAWDTSNVTNMERMFQNAVAFNQDLSGWCVTKISTQPSYFATGATAWTLPKPVWGTCP